VQERFKINQDPQDIFFKEWEQAIPEYDQNYTALKCKIENQLDKHEGLLINANYLNGISFNDCIANAQQLVRKLF